MKIARVFPRYLRGWTPTDDYAFVGDPPLFRPPNIEQVLVSCAFAWDKPRAERLAAAWGQYCPTKIGGPAYDDPGDEFVPGLFLSEGITITSRGCPHQCPFCFVPKREGKIRELEVKPGHIIQDNNLLRTSPYHRRQVFDMLKAQRRAANFRGGIEAAALTDEIADELRSLRIHEIWFAADYDGALPGLRRAVNKIKALGRNKLRCYVLLGYQGETMRQAEARLVAVWEAGCLPFAQLYRDEHQLMTWSKEWRDLARTWSRPAATKARMKGIEGSREWPEGRERMVLA